MPIAIDSINIDAYPEVCPICHHAISATHLTATSLRHRKFPTAHEIVSAAFRCPRANCRAIFIAYYAILNPNSNYWGIDHTAPKKYLPPNLDPHILKISPRFVEIYGQALEAGSLGLNEVHGVGLRKALEFLVKDYCIYRDPAKGEEIKKSYLSFCIKNYVADPNIKKCAELATWLGNDETHYLRQWTNHDISDLGRLIQLTCNWIVNEQLTQEYITSMPPSTKGASSI